MSEQERKEQVILTLTFDDDEEVDCVALGIFNVDGQDYIALLPKDESMAEEVYLYRYDEDEEGNSILGDIEVDSEFNAVSAAFDEIMDKLDK
ncbi:MAG: DUF1292 domain-containing protein [Eubacterium sp.]|nr:DUF1292 domain-containing protein [Eubacterium sp.]